MLLPAAQRLGDELDAVPNVVVRERHDLGLFGRPAGVQHQCDIACLGGRRRSANHGWARQGEEARYAQIGLHVQDTDAIHVAAFLDH